METNNSKEETQTMRNLRKIVALVLAFAMVLSMSAVTFAAEMTAAEKAETLGLLVGEGSGVTAEYLAKTPTRLQAAIISLRLRGLEDEAKAFEGTENFPDAGDIAWAEGKAIAAYLFANPELGWIGDGEGLKPNEPISAQAYVKVMLEALGYAQGVDFEWADVFTFAATVGLEDLSADTVMTNEHLAVGSVEALAATNADGEVLVDVLVAAGAIDEADAVAAGLVEEMKDFALVSAESFGLSAVKLMFASDIDDDVTVTSDDVTIEDVFEDGSVATVLFTAAEDQMSEITLTVTATGVDGIEVDEEDIDVVIADKADPELVSIVAENAKTIVVTYSEPIDPTSLQLGTKVFSDVKIDDAKLVGEAVQSDDLTEITYTLNTKLAANSYVFTMEAVADFAGFVAPSEAQTITVVADDAAPVLVSVEATSVTEVVLTFDEDVDSIGDIVIKGATYNGGAVDIDGKEVTVTITALTASDAFVAVKGEYSAVTDVLDNESDDDIEFSFKAPFDDEAPTVSISVSSDNYLVLDFSEDVTGLTIADITLEDEDGDDVTSLLDAIVADETTTDDYEDEDEDSTIYLVSFDDMTVNEVSYTVTVDGSDDEIEDGSVLKNDVAETVVEITLNDLQKPVVVGVPTIVDADDDIVRLSFDEEMDADTLVDIANYMFNDSPLSLVDDVEFEVAASGKYVDITIPDVVAGDEIKPLSVEDLAGNILDAGDFNVAQVVAAPTPFTVVSAELTAVDTIELVASEEFEVADPNEFTLMEGGVESPTHYFTSAVVDEDDATIIILTLNDDLLPDVTTDNATVITIDIDGDDTVDIFGTSISDAAAVAVADGASATIEAEGASDSIVLTLDEDVVTVAATAASDIIVRDEDGDVVDVTVTKTSGNVYTLTGAALTVDEDTTFTVEVFSRYIEDADGNVVEALAETEVTVED